MSAQPLEGRIAHLEGVNEQILERLADLRSDFAGLRSEFGGLRSEFSDLRKDFDAKFLWLIGVVLGTWITSQLTILFHH